MAAPKDPKEKSKITLDLDLNQVSEKQPKKLEESKNVEDSNIQFRDLNATVKRPEKVNQVQPKPMKPMSPRIKSGKAKSTASRTKPIFIMAGVLIAALLITQYMGGLEPAAPDTTPAPAPQMAAKAPQNVPTERIPQAPPPPPAIADPHVNIRSASLDQLGTNIDDKGNTSFAVRVVPKPVCHPADVEAMRNVFGNTGSLLLSLEPMDTSGKTKAPISRVISLKEITQGTKLSLPVNLKQTGVYGIYICGDAANVRSCSGKKPADFNRILNFRDLDVSANAVFYYQFAVLGLDYATVYTGTANGVSGAREQLSAKKPMNDWKPQLDKAASLMRGVKSLPPKTVVEGNVVTLELQLAMINPDGSCR